MMGYFIPNLSFDLLMKEFLKSANIWQSYRQHGWLCHTPHSSTLLFSEMQKLLLIVVMLLVRLTCDFLSTNIKLPYRQVLTY